MRNRSLIVASLFIVGCAATVKTSTGPAGPPPPPPPSGPVATEPPPPAPPPPPVGQPPPPVAPKPGIHPAYLHAIASLRHARALLEKPAAPDVKWDEQTAVREIDAAFVEIRNARIDDGLPMTEHPVIDSKTVYRDRLREAMKLLNEAALDIRERESNGWAKADRNRAEQHVLNAERAVKEAMEDRKEDKKELKELKKEDKKDQKELKKEEKKEEKLEKKEEKLEKKEDKLEKKEDKLEKKDQKDAKNKK